MISRHFVFLFILISAFSFSSNAANQEPLPKFEQGKVWKELGPILSQRDRTKPINAIVKDRLDNLLPQLMRENNIDMWLVINREYEEDALFFSLVPQPTFAARRTTMLMFFDAGEGKPLERMTVSRYPIKGFYDSNWKGGSNAEQWQQLAKVIAERNPKKIAINTSEHWPLADGLTASLKQSLENALSKKQKAKLVSAENLVVRWMETRTALEIKLWPEIVGLARTVIGEAFSNKVVTPGVTTTDDIEWYIRQRFESLQLTPWFQPHVNLQRRGDKVAKDSHFFGQGGRVVQRGDILHTDVGFCYLTLCTDTQEMGYVLNKNEKSVPQGLLIALAKGNQWQDLLTDQFKTGKTGNQILADNLAANKKAGLLATTYTHPIGLVGHAAGPTIGMWDNQGPTPVRGDWKLFANTGYAIEGNIRTQLPEWDNEWIQIKLEQTSLFDGNKVIYLGGRQTQWHLVE